MPKEEPNIDAIVAGATEGMIKKSGFKPAAQPVQVVEEEILNMGPIDFAAMKGKMTEIPKVTLINPNDDILKVGRAFRIARGMYKKVKATSMDSFLSLYDEIYNNL